MLQQGGNVLFIRHERTDASNADAKPINLALCSTQRNLSMAGVASATENAATIARLDIPVIQVEASPTCRTRDTARMLFGDFEVNLDLGGPFAGQTDMMQIQESVRALALRHVGQDGNVALVSHLGVFRAAFGGHIGEGDIAVITEQDGALVLAGIIPANGWNDTEIDASLASRDVYTQE